MQAAMAIVVAGTACLFTGIAAAGPNPVFAPKLTLSCLSLHFYANNSADLTCKIQDTASGTSPAIQKVVLNLYANNGGFSQYTGGDLTVGNTDQINLHFAPNTYKIFTSYQAFGVANDAIFGDTLVPGEPVWSNSLKLTDPMQPPQFDQLGLCTMETFFPPNLNFPYTGGTGTLVVDTQGKARGYPSGCPWTAYTSSSGVVFGAGGSNSQTVTGPGTATFTVRPNVVVNGSTKSRQAILTTYNAWGFTNVYYGRFTFTQDGLTCAWNAGAITIPQQGIPQNSPQPLRVLTQPGCQWTEQQLTGPYLPFVEKVGTVFTGSTTLNYWMPANPGAGPRTGTIEVGNLTVPWTQTGTSGVSSVTITTNPAGLSILVDNVAYTGASTFQWPTGSAHTLAVTSPQGSGGTRYGFSSWSNGGAQSQTITANATATYTANFNTQYQLTTAASPANTGTVIPASGGYYNAGSSVALTATPTSGFNFTNWTGTVASANKASTSIVMNGPQSVTANFVSSAISVTVNTNVAGLTVTVDGINYPTGKAFQWTQGSSHTLSVISPQDIGSTPGAQDYGFVSWSDGGAQMHSVAPAASVTYTATFARLTSISVVIDTNIQNLPAVDGHGVMLVDGYSYQVPHTFQWAPGSTHTLWASGYVYVSQGVEDVFTSWSDGGADLHTVAPIGPTTYTAYYSINNFQTSPLSSLKKPLSLHTSAPRRIHAGGAAYTDASGNVWEEDFAFSGGTPATNGESVGGTTDPGLYQTERCSASPFRYRLAVPDGNYEVTLKFAELRHPSAGNRLFDVSINGNPVLTNFDPAAVAGGAFTAVEKHFPATATNGQLLIDFHPTVNEATISGIEIVPAADPSTVTGIEVIPSAAVRIDPGGTRLIDPAGNVWDGDYNYSGGTAYPTGRGGSQPFSYRFVVPNGHYWVTLNDTGLFDILVNGQNVTPHQGADSIHPTIPVSVENGEIVLQFTPQSAMSVVNAIEVLQMQ
jgi:hypothetical protein